ncbi:ABC transporter permease [Bacillus sp. FJAT-49736]|uniref:FtsX-like permease family protein n=1 Tax=Bacillus sp. FJAT-49736 TaxID=2833582 RepID=UPI001BC9B9E9|nr:ABC transporter permease [Bacillus sp. FJAT-49736]MBS4175256.1 ABC transporter permease [Bacillus sp. FJAT-49736]
MTLFSLARRNLKTNTKQYLLYFYPMVLSIVIYFTFVSLQYNNQIIQTATALGKVQPAFMASSVLLFLFSATFIWYSNSFFTRKRKKEIALYSLFGICKKQIARLLFYENLITGFIALGVGIAIGAILSKLFAMLLIKLMGFSFIATFYISSKAIIQTLVVFTGIIGVTAIHNYRIIYRYTLIELLKADKQGPVEKKASKITALLSLLILGVGYYILLLPGDSAFYKRYGFTAVMFSLLFMLIGTFLFNRSVFHVFLEKLETVRGIYFKGTNLISVSHLRFRMKGNVVILSMIASLTTITLFTLGAIFGFHHNLLSETSKNYPLSIMYTSQSKEIDYQVERLIKEDRKHSIVFSKKLEYLQLEGDLSSTGRWSNQQPILLISETEYQKLATKMGLKYVKNIGKDRAVVFHDGNLNQNKDPYTGKTVQLSDQSKLTIQKYEKGHLLNQSYYSFPMVINNSQYQQLKKHNDIRYMQIYKLENEKSMGELSKEIEDKVYKTSSFDEALQYSSFHQEYERGVQTYGLLIFIGAFLGIVFLLATGSMLYYKQLTEATADKERYKILRKIGMNRKQMKGTIAKQILPVFVLPLVMAIPNSSVILSTLARFANINMLQPYLITIAIYIGIYFGYYLLTVRKYTSIINY